MKGRNLRQIALLASALAFAAAGCSGMMNGLRRDLDDTPAYDPGPTTGGAWTEGGFLSDDLPEAGQNAYGSVGHAERDPASASAGQPGQDSWQSQDQYDQNQRDRYRAYGPTDEEGNPITTYSNTPNLAPGSKRMYKNGARATAADFVDDSQNEGSLWASNGQTNYYFTKNKVRGVGDIVTVTVEDGLIKDIATEVRRTLSPRERETEIALAQERIREKFNGKDSVKTSAAAPAPPQQQTAQTPGTGAPAPAPTPTEAQVPEATAADIDVLPSLSIKAGETIMAEIVQRYPNGNYKLRGTKRIPYKAGYPRLLTLVGVAKSTDISEDDKIASGKLYEYQLEVIH